MSKQKQDMVERFDPEYQTGGLTRWLSGKESACQCRRLRFNPWVGKIPWRRAWQPTHILAWRIPWIEEPGGLQSMVSQRVRHEQLSTHALVGIYFISETKRHKLINVKLKPIL